LDTNSADEPFAVDTPPENSTPTPAETPGHQPANIKPDEDPLPDSIRNADPSDFLFMSSNSIFTGQPSLGSRPEEPLLPPIPDLSEDLDSLDLK
jgi:hypothetical protein